MNIKPEQRNNFFKRAIIFSLILLCFLSFVWFVSTFKQLKRGGNIGIDYSITGHPTRLHHAFSTNDIRMWMTFDYLNVVFRLNPSYLKNALNITDSRYPNISLNSYIKHHHINPQVFLQNINSAIINYPQNN